ncbi:RNA polymerase I enhancer binding protein [Coemansia sp. Benny D160-2]|nr:RNA polymerase I enhancer binding protein [Coemansia sp. Benny D160-2]
MGVAGARRSGGTAMQAHSAQQPPRQNVQQQQQRRHQDFTAAAAEESGDPDSQDLISLVELLQTYPGLLDDKVEDVARALAQATLAVSAISLQYGESRQLTPLQRIRMSKRAAPAAVPEAAMDHPTRQASRAAEHMDGSRQTQAQAATGRSDRLAQKSERRWFTQQHVQRLQSEGIVFTKGKFTIEENAAIDSAISLFLATHGLNRREMYGHLFGHKAVDDSDKHLRRLFWPILSEALPARQIQAIYHHVRRKYHPHNYQGAWTADEDDELRRLIAAHGPAWEAISQRMGRMGTSCRDRWRYIQFGARSQGNPQRRKQQPKPALSGARSPAAPGSTGTMGKADGNSSNDGSAGDVAATAPISAP